MTQDERIRRRIRKAWRRIHRIEALIPHKSDQTLFEVMITPDELPLLTRYKYELTKASRLQLILDTATW